ncbi:hypothetical protein VIGAN_08231200, partial [Vigna angularis var. angularis]
GYVSHPTFLSLLLHFSFLLYIAYPLAHASVSFLPFHIIHVYLNFGNKSTCSITSRCFFHSSYSSSYLVLVACYSFIVHVHSSVFQAFICIPPFVFCGSVCLLPCFFPVQDNHI